MIKEILTNSPIWPTWTLWTLAIVFVFTLFICIPRLRRFLDYLSDHLLGVTLIVWCIGMGLYTIGAYEKDLGFWTNVPRAIISSIKMFLTGNDLSRMHDELQADNVYMVIFSLTHFAAALISVLFVIKLIGFKIKASVDLFISTFFSSFTNKPVNIFWGVNEASFLLAEDICRHEKNSKIVFVNTEDIYDDPSAQKIGLKSLLDVMSFSRSEISRIEDMNALAVNCHYDLSGIQKGTKDVFGSIRLKSIRKFIRNSYRTRIFLLSDDESGNINSALNLLEDETLKRHKDATIYIQAFSNRLNEIYNHYPQYAQDDNNIKLQTIDTSFLSIALLKMKPEHHPVNIMDIDTDLCTVSSCFNSLIIGFSETGLEAFRFLYEYGSFIKYDGSKAEFHCHAIDKDMSRIEGRVRDMMPAISETELQMHDFGIESNGYWELLQEVASKLNYVIIAIGNDDDAMLAAMDIFRKVAQARRNNLKSFRIYVRCYDWHNHRRMRDLADKLNEANINTGGQIIIFGGINELFTYNMIIRNKVMQSAMQFNKAYEKTDDTAEKAWKDSFGEGAAIRKLHMNPSCSRMQVIDDINRCISQNMANCFHKDTKLTLLGIKESGDLSDIKEIIGSRKTGTVTYTKADTAMQQRLMNLARCEHLRWESSHKLLGYTYASTKDMICKKHDCLIPWEELDEKAKSYDCDVVDTSIRMTMEP